MANDTVRERGPQVGFEVPQELFDALEDVKKRTGMAVSHLGREALWEKVAEIKKTHPAFANDTVAEPA